MLLARAVCLTTLAGALVGCGGSGGTGPDAAEDVSVVSDAVDLVPAERAGDSGADGGGCGLRESGPVSATADDQVIQNLRIVAVSGDALTVVGWKRVTVRDCEIHHRAGAGITFSNADDLHLQRVVVVNDGAPANGANAGPAEVSIGGELSQRVVIENVRLLRGSSGISLRLCPATTMSFVEIHDVRGPAPAGHGVLLDKCNGSTLQDFSVENQGTSWTSDLVSVFQTSYAKVLRGHLLAGNSPTGIGVVFDMSDGVSEVGECADVDARWQTFAAFGARQARNVSFARTRARDAICGDQGRGAPVGPVGWYASPGSTQVSVIDSRYHGLCAEAFGTTSTISTHEAQSADFVMRGPQRLSFCWSAPTP